MSARTCARIAAWGACALALALPCRAASVVLTLRERDGPLVHDQHVAVHPPLAAGERLWTVPRDRVRRGVTGGDGKVVLDGLSPGAYTVSLEGLADPSLIAPEDNPYAPAPVFTLEKDDDRVELVIELWRGVPVTAQVLVDRGDVPRTKLVFRGVDGRRTLELRPDPMAQGLLLPGRWEAWFELPAGYLLTDLVWNGDSLPGHVVRLDLTEELRLQSLTAYLSAQSLITGTITSQIRAECPAQIVATLVEPAGDWLAGALARGGSEFHRVTDQFRKLCVYKLWLPAGRWLVRAEGEQIVRSDPESVDVSIGPGETRAVDFYIETAEGSAGKTLRVSVLEPEARRRPPEAVVEIWSPEGTASRDEPLRSERVEGFPLLARFEGLAKGRYRVVAGHADYLESADFVTYDPGDKEPAAATLVLREGARVHARSRDEAGHAVGQVEIEVERLGEPPAMELADEGIRVHKLRRRELTDATGHAEVRGFYAGSYGLTGRMSGELAQTRFVRIRGQGERLVDSLEVSLVEGERLDVDLVVLPAASLAGSLVCSDGGTLPAQASFRIFEAAGAVPDPWRDPELQHGAVLAVDAQGLEGKFLDRFRVGPLERGARLVAVRPGGHEYWSWPPDLLVPERSTVFDLRDSTTLDTGLVEIACGPVVMLVPTIASREAVPDLQLGTLEVSAWTATAAGKRTSVPSAVETYEERWFVRQLPEGEVQLDARVAHPYLVPAELRLPATKLDLERGKLVTLELAFKAVGGRIEVRDPEARAARRISPDGSAMVQPFVEGRVSFPGTLPGRYRVEACAAADCRSIARAWDDVVVSPARTLRLP